MVTHPDIGSALTLLSPFPENDKSPMSPPESSSCSDSSDESGAEDTSPIAMLPCDACGKVFKQRGALGMHMKSHFSEIHDSSGNITNVKCNACGTMMKNRVVFFHHIKRCTKRHVFRESGGVEKDTPYHCHLCGNSFEQPGALGMHFKTHMIENTSKSGEILSMQCKLCKEVFKNRSAFLEHSCSASLGNKASIKCKSGSCTQMFTSRSSMLRHYAVKHSSPQKAGQLVFKSSTVIEKAKQASMSSGNDDNKHSKPSTPGSSKSGMTYHCGKCQKYFSSMSDLNRHKDLKHNFECGTCGKKLMSKESYLGHLNSFNHKPGKVNISPVKMSPSTSPFYSGPKKCENCNKKFAHQHALVRHKFYCKSKETDSDNSEENDDLKCKSCGKVYGNKKYLNKHSLNCKVKKDGDSDSEYEFKCQVCGRLFPSNKSLASHKGYCKPKTGTDSDESQDSRKRKSLPATPTSSNGPTVKVKRIDSTPLSIKKKTQKGTTPSASNSGNTNGQKSSNSNVNSSQKSTQSSSFSCSVCKLEINDSALFAKHESICKERNSSNGNPTKPTSDSIGYECETCSKIFKTEATYVKHKLANKMCITTRDIFIEESHACLSCKERFNAIFRITGHAKVEHTGSDQDKATAAYHKGIRYCQVCGDTIQQPRVMYWHHMWIEHGLRTKYQATYYKCDECHQRFIEPKEYMAHVDEHSGGKNHQCGICSMKFRRKPLLEKHITEKHSIDTPVASAESE